MQVLFHFFGYWFFVFVSVAVFFIFLFYNPLQESNILEPVTSSLP